MKNQIGQLPVSGDQIDLQELWNTLIKRKWIIIGITAFALIATMTYAWILKPIYSGGVLIEVGEVIINSEQTNNKPTIIQPLEKPGDLNEIMMQVINDGGLRIESPSGSSKLIKITYEHSDKKKIHEKLEESIAFILSRHNEKAKFFENANAKISLTNVIGTVTIGERAIKPNTSLIVAVGFIGGLMLGIFCAFLIEFFQNGRKETSVESK